MLSEYKVWYSNNRAVCCGDFQKTVKFKMRLICKKLVGLKCVQYLELKLKIILKYLP